MSKAMLSICATFDPTVTLSRAGSSSKALVTFLCETSTPLGFPVLPVECVSVRHFTQHDNIPDVYITYAPSCDVMRTDGFVEG
jgi:hypothetical protein